MDHMFKNARWFDQDISAWNISNVKQMKNIFYGSGISEENMLKFYSNVKI